MSKPPRDLAITQSRTYFLTMNAWSGRSLFQVHRFCYLLLSTLQNYREQQKFQIHEFVLMPNHVHLLLTPAADFTLERSVQLIKGGFSFRVAREAEFRGEVWQRSYVDHRIRDSRDYSFHREYIHQNPVRARLASVPAEYQFSSANSLHILDPAPLGLKPRSFPSSGMTKVMPSRSP
jgi:putative transposase